MVQRIFTVEAFLNKVGLHKSPYKCSFETTRFINNFV